VTPSATSIWSRRVLLAVLLFQGVSALLGGLMLFGQAAGAVAYFPDEWLTHIPFDNWFWPGVILGGGLGASALALAVGLWRRVPWAWAGAVGLGIGLMAWIVVQRLLIPGTTWLQPFYFAVGAVIVALALTGGVGRTLAARRSLKGALE
jgi:hypothetical protein